MRIAHLGTTVAIATAIMFGHGLRSDAASVTWDGDTSWDWFNGANWSGGLVPGPGDDVVVDGVGTDPILSSDSAYLATFTITNQTLTFTNWATALKAAAVSVRDSATLTHYANTATATNALGVWVPDSRVYIVCTNLTLDAGGAINADELGYAAGYGAGRATYSGGDYGGGGYGGRGGKAVSDAAIQGETYGSSNAPVDPGSGGGRTGSLLSGAGGGVVRIAAEDVVTIDGEILASGESTSKGGGSGGSIYISCSTFQGSAEGLLRADGGNAHVADDGGGGGGRIAVTYTGLGAPRAVRFSTMPGTGWHNDDDNMWQDGARNGTLYLSSTNLLGEVLTGDLFTGIDLYVDGFNAWNPACLTVSNCSLTFGPANFELLVDSDLVIGMGGVLGVRGNITTAAGDLVVTNGGSLIVYGGPTNAVAEDPTAVVSITGNVHVASASRIHPTSDPEQGGHVAFRMADLLVSSGGAFMASGRGFFTGSGDGKGLYSGGDYAGGGHGGRGGWGTQPASAGGNAYDSIEAPVRPGSGGGRVGGRLSGSAGGGVIRIDATGDAVVDGAMVADGMTHISHGGGAGGSIYLSCATLSGSGGEFSVNGGSSSTGDDGGGAGGRIAVDYTAIGVLHDLGFSATPGNGWANANFDDFWHRASEMGSLHLADTNLLSNLANAGAFQDVRLYVPGFTSWNVPSLTVSDNSLALGVTNFALTVAGDIRIGPAGGLTLSEHAALTCGGDLVLTNGGALTIHAGETNGLAAAGNGALVSVTGDIVIDTNAWLYPVAHPTDGATVVLRMDGLSISPGGGINAIARGYSVDNGPGAGGTHTRGGGGGYGGRGGASASGGTAGLSYGITNRPIDAGSGGGKFKYGGFGGGAVRVEAAGSVVINGAVLARGGKFNNGNGGGAAGGGILIAAEGPVSASATALLDAHGSDGTATLSGAGGGGRVAIWHEVPAAIRDQLLAGVSPMFVVETNSLSGFDATIDVTNGVGWAFLNPPIGDEPTPGTTTFLTYDPPPAGTIMWLR